MEIVQIGVIIVFIGMLLIVVGSLGSGKADVGVGGFIGPIPFGYFSSKRMFWIWLVILGLMVVGWFLLRRFL